MTDIQREERPAESDRELSRVLKEWWDRDKVVSSVKHAPQFNKEFLQTDDVNNSINRMFDDLRILKEGDKLRRMHRERVAAPMTRHSEEDIYRSLSKEGRAFLDDLSSGVLEDELIKTAASVLAMDPETIKELTESGGI